MSEEHTNVLSNCFVRDALSPPMKIPYLAVEIASDRSLPCTSGQYDPSCASCLQPSLNLQVAYSVRSTPKSPRSPPKSPLSPSEVASQHSKVASQLSCEVAKQLSDTFSDQVLSKVSLKISSPSQTIRILDDTQCCC